MAKLSKANQRKADMQAFRNAQAERKALKAGKSCNLTINEDVIGAKGIKKHPHGVRLTRRELNKRIKKGLIPIAVRNQQDAFKEANKTYE